MPGRGSPAARGMALCTAAAVGVLILAKIQTTEASEPKEACNLLRQAHVKVVRASLQPPTGHCPSCGRQRPVWGGDSQRTYTISTSFSPISLPEGLWSLPSLWIPVAGCSGRGCVAGLVSPLV